MHIKLLREHYKTYDGADRRARFENGIAGSEFRNGYKAHLYRYVAIPDHENYGCFRVERRLAEQVR